MSAKKLPRGIKNNNPGNIRHGDPWEGRDDLQDDLDFIRFKEPKWGIRAIALLLIAYRDRHGLRTIKGIINRWAPPKGRGPGGAYTQDTGKYVSHVSDLTGFAPDQDLDVSDFATAKALVQAIIRHENGQQPYSDATIDAGLRLAGIEPPLKPLSQSKTIAGAVVTTVGAGGIPAAEAVQTITQVGDALSPLETWMPWIKGLCALITIAGIAITVWARLKDRKQGLK